MEPISSFIERNIIKLFFKYVFGFPKKNSNFWILFFYAIKKATKSAKFFENRLSWDKIFSPVLTISFCPIFPNKIVISFKLSTLGIRNIENSLKKLTKKLEKQEVTHYLFCQYLETYTIFSKTPFCDRLVFLLKRKFNKKSY